MCARGAWPAWSRGPSTSPLEVTWGEFSAAKKRERLGWTPSRYARCQTRFSCRRLRLAPQTCARGYELPMKFGARAQAALMRSSAAPVAMLARRGLELLRAQGRAKPGDDVASVEAVAPHAHSGLRWVTSNPRLERSSGSG